MSHHGEIPFDALDEDAQRKMREVFDQRRKLADAFRQSQIGATGEFPEGKIAEHDEGEIAFAVGHRHGKVLIEFGTPVAWMGMNPQQAIALANTLITHAKRCRLIGDKTPNSRHKANGVVLRAAE